ncbi:MAG: hypothetical protein IJO72_07665 [Oscillospiraceae bacterium]|nr:hypothetical protein [Oscillospiraceae bacterium]
MRKSIPILLCVVLIFSLCGCEGLTFEHKTFTQADDYSGIFELTELRYSEVAMELFPETVSELTVCEFYCEWERGIVGSAKVELLLSVQYEAAAFTAETDRLKALADGKIVYDTQHFQYPAYVSVLGNMNTNYYALVDEENQTVHYLLLQLVNAENVDFDQAYLPAGYGEFGANQELDFNVYYDA